MFVRNSILLFLVVLFLGNLSTSYGKMKAESYGELRIPKLGFQETIYEEDKYNDWKSELYLLADSNLSNNNETIVIHSKNTRLCSLSIHDEIQVKREGNISFFKIILKYEEEKNGEILNKESSRSSLVLLVCSKDSFPLQTIFYAVETGRMIKI